MKPSEIQDFYTRLGIDRNATPDEIKKSYRISAFQWHPDRNPASTIQTQEFVAVSKAYEILSDPKKRRAYDDGNSIDAILSQPEGRYEYYSSVFDVLFEDIRRSGFTFDLGALKEEEIKRKSGYYRGQHFGNVYWLDSGDKNLELSVCLESDNRKITFIRREGGMILKGVTERGDITYCGEGFLIRNGTSPLMHFEEPSERSFLNGTYDDTFITFVSSKRRLPVTIDISRLNIDDMVKKTLHFYFLRRDLDKVRGLEDTRLNHQIFGESNHCKVKVFPGNQRRNFVFEVDYYKGEGNDISLEECVTYQSDKLPEFVC